MTFRAPVAAAALLACAGTLAAQTPEPRWKTQIDLSWVQASGNTRLSTLHLSDNVVYHVAPWKFTQTFDVVNAATNGTQTANAMAASLRGDYAIRPRFRVYGLGAWERDRYAGLARRLREEAGLSFGALAAPRDTLDTEVGIGLTQELPDTLPERDFASSRLAARYRHVFRTNTYFEGKSELLSNLQDGADSRVNADLALVAPLSRFVAVKLGYVVRFDNQPEPGKKGTDTVASAGLQIVF